MSVESTSESELTDELSGSTGSWAVLAPRQETLIRFARVVDSLDDPPAVEIIADGTTLRKAARNFPANARLGELEHLSIRKGDVEEMTTEIIGEDVIVSEVRMPGEETLCLSTDPGLLEAFWDEVASIRESTTEFSGDLPRLSQVYDSAQSAFGAPFVDDLQTAVEMTDEPGNPDVVDPILVAAIATAAHELLHYDLTRWADSHNLSSKATVSRKTTKLEDKGVITSSSVKSTTGRPKKRWNLEEPYASQYNEEGIRPLVETFCF